MTTTILPFVLMLFAAPSVPASAREVPPGTPVRVTWTDTDDEARPTSTTGRVVAKDATGLIIEEEGADRTTVRVPWASVRSIYVATRPTTVDVRVVKGVAYGFAIGAVTGAALAQATDHGCRSGELCLFSHGDTVRMEAAALGLAGGLLGGLFAHASGQQWSLVPVHPDRVTVAPQVGRHTAGVRVAVRF